ncbi:hypothetical protein C1A38_28130 [Verrucosispora sp. ts21]|uniref:hypothetical protein n=1 Tax=Verrucosispora sp. ts21 TaxID=2069341 RepID=UPI000C88A83B|nr:hypothetical protein [Verrucosispora sp. ts21]PMR57775.1 hypothetical protein C1A38_28130 [Verrucosispora sp. ts21]
MTSPAEPPPHTPTPAAQVTGPLRELAALVLLAANAVFLFVGLIRLVTPQGAYSTVTGRAGSAFFAFIGLEAVVLPVLAVLLATHIAPAVPRAKLITQVALVEYAVSAVLGGLTLLIWTVGRLAEAQIFDALTGMLTRAAWVALFGVAAYVVWSIWRRLYHVPRPKAEPGMYGTPQSGWPGNPGQPGGAPGQPWYPGQPGPGGAGQSGYPGQPAPGQSGYAGQPGPGGVGQSGYPGQSGSGEGGQSGYPAGGWSSGGWSAGDQPSSTGAGQETGSGAGWPMAGQAPSSPESSASPHTWPPHGQPAVPPQSPPSASQPSAPPFGQPASTDATQTIARQNAEPTEAITRPGAEPTQAIARPSEATSSGDPTEAIARPGAEPTQALPRPDGDEDRTRRIDLGGQST